MVEPRAAKPTTFIVPVINRCFQKLDFEAFKQLHLGLISETKRKSLPAIAQVGVDNANHCTIFWQHRPGKVTIQQQRLRLILETLATEIVLVIDDTGDRKRGITLITTTVVYVT